jgi:hypothetical protein
MEMSKKKSKGFNPMNFAIDNATINAGTMVGVGMVGKIGESMPSPLSGKIMQGMEPMAMIPTLHATGGVFQSLQSLNKQVKKRR